MTPVEFPSIPGLPQTIPSESDINRLMEGGGAPEGIASYPLEAFPDLPVRLRHCYEWSNCSSLGGFLALKTEGRFSLRNYGRKTEAALRSIVSNLAARNWYSESALKAADSAGSNGKYSSEPSFEILRAHEKPWNLITEEMWSAWGQRLKSKASLRVSDVASILELRWPGNMRSATLGDFIAVSLEEFSGLHRMGKVKMKTIVLSVAYSVYYDDQPELDSIERILDLPALRNLDERERFILEKRLLVPERLQMTLEAVSREQGVTRERIRQVEKIILNRLKESACGTRIGQLLEASKADIFQRLSVGELYLTSEQLIAKEHEFGGPQLLAIYLEGRTLRAWLDARFFKIKDCWFCGTTEEWSTIERRLAGWRAEQLPLPEAVVAGSSNVTVREARSYFRCSGHAVPFEGYFLPSGNVLAKRSARLHAFIAAEAWSGKDPAFAAEACSEATGVGDGIDHARHGYRAIMSTPSLFLASPGAVVPIHQASPWRPTRIEFIEDFEDTSNIPNAESKIVSVVRRIGPSTLNAAIEACGKDPNVEVAPGSVGAIVSQSRRFVRLAPGLYDVRDCANYPDRIEQARALMLNERDVRRYCFAKHSGEELASMYPLWDAEQEKRWALWGKSALASDVWGSLMVVSSPEEWPKGSALNYADWAQWKADGRWRYKVTWNDDLPTDIPSVRDVLLVAQYCRLVGHITWIRANHVLGATQVTERAGLSAVVLGVILGLVAPSGRTRWLSQRSHPEFDREWIDYENLLIADPELSWNNPIFQSRFSRASLRAASGELGWVEANEISVLRSISSSGQSSSRATALVHIEEEAVEDEDVRI